MASILIIDDDPKVLEALTDTLSQTGYSIRTAVDGASGIRCFEAHPPDLVITDINMPDVEGIELIRRLARSNRRVPVIAISGDPVGSQFLKAARLLGAVETLLKPFSAAELQQKIRAALAAGPQPPPRPGRD